MLFASDFRQNARKALSGRWGLAIGTSVVGGLLGASIYSSFPSINITNFIQDGEFAFNNQTVKNFIGIPSVAQDAMFLDSFFIGIFVISIGYLLLKLIIGGATTLGYAKFNLNLVNDKDTDFSDLFSDFNRMWQGFCMQFLRSLYIFLWSLLLFIPGVIATYRYAMTPYIMADHPEYNVSDAIAASKSLMVGNKWRLFCLEFSFIGWIFLGVLTLGIGLFWVFPYTEAARAAFYREICVEQGFSNDDINDTKDENREFSNF